jgi:hypothetical protein
VAAFPFPELCGMGYRPESKKKTGIARVLKVANCFLLKPPLF